MSEANLTQADGGRAPGPALPPVFADWFAARGWSPRAHQLALLEQARAGRSALLVAPTGGGKTLAGFLPSLIDLAEGAHGSGPGERPHRLHTLYVSPLKALAVDVARNIETPAAEMGLGLRIETRTGDTPPAKRQRQRARPPDILLTTPEQVSLFIASENARVFFEDLEAVIVDEIHALAPGKRGDLLVLALARIRQWAPRARFVGLSATVNDPAKLARWLGGRTSPAAIVTGAPGAPADVRVLEPGDGIPWAGHTGRHAMSDVLEVIKRCKTTLVFVNTRSQAELVFQELWSLNEDALPIALHHGSLAREQRRKVEAAMSRGALRAIVCTSTLDLGIDWGDVDMVIQMGAPKGAARLIQRIGRANHRLDEASQALLVPSNRFEVLECNAAREAVAAGELDAEPFRSGALDCLAQHIMGCACGEPFSDQELFEEVRNTEPYAGIDRETFESVVDFVATGGYALRAYDRLKRIVKGRDGLWRARNARIVQGHRMNVGAIIDTPMLEVRLVQGAERGRALRKDGRPGAPLSARSGRKLGEMDEAYIEAMAPGDSFLFGGQTVRLIGVEGTAALVAPASHPEPKIPIYAGGRFPLSQFLAARVRKTIHEPESWGALPAPVQEWLALQSRHSSMPRPDQLLIETFPHRGREYLICYPFDGRLAHQTLGMLLTRRLERAGFKPTGFLGSEYAVMIWGLEPMGGADMDALFDEDMMGDDLEAWLAESILMKRTFRDCAIIAGLIERRFPGQEKTGRQMTFSADLIYDVLKAHEPDHMLLKAAWADAAHGYLDLGRLSGLLKRIQGGLLHRDLDRVSPFAVPVMLEMNRNPVAGEAAESVLAALSEADLVAEAVGGGG